MISPANFLEPVSRGQNRADRSTWVTRHGLTHSITINSSPCSLPPLSPIPFHHPRRLNMLPLFGDERKRKINLGGASTASSHRAILEQARAQRDERSAQKRREASAIRVQAWWRGVQQARSVRLAMRRAFEGDVKGLVGLRCLVLMGARDEEALSVWSREMVGGGIGMLSINS